MYRIEFLIHGQGKADSAQEQRWFIKLAEQQASER